jgi:hypothetical protein
MDHLVRAETTRRRDPVAGEPEDRECTNRQDAAEEVIEKLGGAVWYRSHYSEPPTFDLTVNPGMSAVSLPDTARRRRFVQFGSINSSK